MSDPTDVTADDALEEAQRETDELISLSPDDEAASASASMNDALAQERDAYKETLQRVQADFENYRKRVLKQQEDQLHRAAEDLVTKLLPVLDTIDLALAHDPNGSLEQVKAALNDILKKEGLERIQSVEQPFDPTLHEAVAHEPGEGEPHVSEEMRAGYRWNGRVIRPAMVKVTGS